MIRLPFTRDLLSFLAKEGYTHVYNMGVRDNPYITDNEENETFIIIPLKADDSRLCYQEVDMYIEDINHHEVLDMADGDEFINFVVELHVKVAEKYLTS